MLPAALKLSTSSDFRRTMRGGSRAGSRTLVVHLRARTETAITGGPRFGLVVSKQVGNAVTRHAVSRKLRHIARELAPELPREFDVVIRALPASADATSAQLAHDFSLALGKARKKGAGRRGHVGANKQKS